MDSKELRGLMEACAKVYAPEQIDEAVKGADPEMRKAASAERRAGDKPLPTKEGEKFAKFKASQISYIDKKTKGKYIPGMTREEFDIFDVVLEFLQAEGIAETLEEAEWVMANLIDEETIGIILGEGKLPLDQQRRSKIGRQIGKRIDSAGKDLAGSGAPFMPKSIRNNLRQSATKKAGEVNKMVGALKSAQKYAKEEYVDEAQAARENPEKYEREQAKKSAPVRGERTPMPPRGDKRREDFEKWYAANVR